MDEAVSLKSKRMISFEFVIRWLPYKQHIMNSETHLQDIKWGFVSPAQYISFAKLPESLSVSSRVIKTLEDTYLLSWDDTNDCCCIEWSFQSFPTANCCRNVSPGFTFYICVISIRPAENSQNQTGREHHPIKTSLVQSKTDCCS